MTAAERARGALLGLAVGDAVGVAAEFQPRGTFPEVTDMTGGGAFGLAPGRWTDDTSMALCLAESLLERGRFDPADQMARYLRWFRDGHLSSTGACFDIGNTVRAALVRFEETGEPFSGSTDPRSAGNGSIMRLAPVVLFGYPDIERAEALAAESSRTTHGTGECVDACRLLARIVCRALDGAGREEVLVGDAESFRGAPRITAIARGEWRDKSRDEIRGTGYVVESLEAALWCVDRTASFREAVLAAANLGDDADTTAAVAGQVAGALYGDAAIPDEWRERLAMGSMIAEWAERLVQARPGPEG